MTHVNAPAERLDLSALGREFVDNPYPVLARLREEEPVRRVRYHGVPAWLVTRFADAEAAYSERLLSADKANAPAEVLAVPWVSGSKNMGLGRGMLFLDPPEHTRLRRMVSKAFTARRVESLRDFTRAAAQRLLDAAVVRGRVDLLRDFAVPLANQVIMSLIGVPGVDVETFAEHSRVFLSTDPADLARLPQALGWLRPYIDGLVAAKRSEPGDDLLSALVLMRDEGDALAEVELGSMALLLLMAGFETTASQIATGLLALVTHPDQLAALRAEPALVPVAIEEMVRWQGAAMASLPRYATADLTLGGVRVSRGEAVIVSWAAANRDPRRFMNPDTFDIRRADRGHIGFAHGIHYCLGAPLARMELEEAFAVLIERDFALAVPPEQLSWRVTPLMRGLTSLPVHVTEPAAAG